jgi:hypothetical protein
MVCRNKTWRNLSAHYLLDLAIVNLSGCVTTPVLPSPESRLHLGHVGIKALASTADVDFHTFAKGWTEGTVKGGAIGLA